MRNYLFLCSWLVGLLSPARIHAWYYPGRPPPVALTYRELVASRRQDHGRL